MIRNKVVWDKHYNSNRLTVRNIFLFCYSRFRLMCTFKGMLHTALLRYFVLPANTREASRIIKCAPPQTILYLNKIQNF